MILFPDIKKKNSERKSKHVDYNINNSCLWKWAQGNEIKFIRLCRKIWIDDLFMDPASLVRAHGVGEMLRETDAR